MTRQNLSVTLTGNLACIEETNDNGNYSSKHELILTDEQRNRLKKNLLQAVNTMTGELIFGPPAKKKDGTWTNKCLECDWSTVYNHLSNGDLRNFAKLPEWEKDDSVFLFFNGFHTTMSTDEVKWTPEFTEREDWIVYTY